MTTTKRTKAVRPPSRSYLKLIAAFPLRPIRSEDELQAAFAVVEELINEDLDTKEADYLDTLAAIIQEYERKHYPIPDAKDGDVLGFLMEGRDLSQTQPNTPNTVSQSTISAILRGARLMTREQVETFAKYFNYPPAVFLPRVMGKE